MARYIVEITRDEGFAKANLKEPFRWLYLTNQKSLFYLISHRKDIRQYKTDETDLKVTYVQEGELEHLKQEKEKLDKFFLGELDSLKEDGEYKHIVNNGRLNKVMMKLKKIRDYSGSTILSFFNNMGIQITLKIE